MATITCNLCGGHAKVSLYEYWTCRDCGVDYAIRLQEHTSEELGELLNFFSEIRANSGIGSAGGVLALMKSLEDSDDPESFTSCIDTLLLFFDSVVVPSIPIDQLIHTLGEKKFQVYHENRFLKCADISFLQATFSGVDQLGTAGEESIFDIDLVREALPSPSHQKHSRFELVMALMNLEHLIRNELLDVLKASNLFNIHRVGSSEIVRLRGREYRDYELANIIPQRFLRSELFCHFFSFSLLYDQHYGIANMLKQLRFLRGWAEGELEFRCFHQWLSSSPFALKCLEPEQVLEFREQYGSLTTFVSAIQDEVAAGHAKLETTQPVQAFGSELEKRIRHFRKVKSKSHERKAVYLTGLLNTLGSVMGGPLGAVIGGIGGNIAANLALDFDRKVNGPIGFIAEDLFTA